MNENQLIATLTQNWAVDATVLTGVGDDCAVLKGDRAGHYWLFKTDAVVEGRHFTPQTPANLVGRKALARVLSDFAAMGGVPLYALITLGLPKKFDLPRLRSLYAGLTKLARTYQVNLVGGETTRTRELLVSISALGKTILYRPLLRSGAKVGDHLFVTGRLGGSLAGKHLTFTPRLAEGQFLAKHRLASAMMDLSDGLGSDLPRLAQASQVGFRLDRDRLPLNPKVTWKQACADGEDYELLFTVRPRKIAQLHKTWPFRTPYTAIGTIIQPCTTDPLQLNIPDGFDHLQHS